MRNLYTSSSSRITLISCRVPRPTNTYDSSNDHPHSKSSSFESDLQVPESSYPSNVEATVQELLKLAEVIEAGHVSGFRESREW